MASPLMSRWQLLPALSSPLQWMCWWQRMPLGQNWRRAMYQSKKVSQLFCVIIPNYSWIQLKHKQSIDSVLKLVGILHPKSHNHRHNADLRARSSPGPALVLCTLPGKQPLQKCYSTHCDQYKGDIGRGSSLGRSCISALVRGDSGPVNGKFPAKWEKMAIQGMERQRGGETEQEEVGSGLGVAWSPQHESRTLDN